MTFASFSVRAARSCAVSLMALSMLASALPSGHAPTDFHSHSEPRPSTQTPRKAGFELQALWSVVVLAWTALRSQAEICQDCNLPVDNGCRCPCYSGGYDPSDPDCQ